MPKTHNGLHAQVHDFATLYEAWGRARRGKRTRPDVMEFSAHLGENLLELQAELRDLTWRPGEYRQRIVEKPKRRIINIAPFRDRVAHQALCAVVMPLFEEAFIYDSYACRIGKGSHAAVDRLTVFLRREGSTYVLKGDLSKYFDSIPHGLIMRELEWKIADSAVLELVKRILNGYETDFQGPPGFGPRGVPIGNLTSQWFANIVGNCLDQHVKHVLKCKRYVRYMDDFLLISNNKAELNEWLSEICKLLAGMGLVLNPKTRIVTTKAGVPFLGYRVWTDHRRGLRPNVVAGRQRMRLQAEMVRQGELDGHVAVESLRSWFAHLAHADTYGLRKSLWREVRETLGEYT